MSDAAKPQPPSIPNDETAIIDLVVRDLKIRSDFGTQKYGTKLQPHNGRDALLDAYQEALDLCMYLRQELEERRSHYSRGYSNGIDDASGVFPRRSDRLKP